MTLEDCVVARAVFRWGALLHLITWHEHNSLLRSVIWQERRLVSCVGKQPFTSYRQAERIATRPHDGPPYVVYRCRVCRAFHLGEALPELRRLREERRAVKAAREHA